MFVRPPYFGGKRHITVDANGPPYAILVTAANMSDRAGALAMFLLNDDTLSSVFKILVNEVHAEEDSADRGPLSYVWVCERANKDVPDFNANMAFMLK